jgi:membrane protein required for beta-lactamase induction
VSDNVKILGIVLVVVAFASIFTTLAFLNNRYFGYGLLAFWVVVMGPLCFGLIKYAATMRALDREAEREEPTRLDSDAAEVRSTDS